MLWKVVVHITIWKKEKRKDNYTWVRKRILSATCSPTLVHSRYSTWHPFTTFIIGWRPFIAMHPSAFGNDCDHTVFVFSIFSLSVTEMDSQPNVVSYYGQVYISQKVCISGPMFIELYFFILVDTTTSQSIRYFLTPCVPLYIFKLL